MQVRGEKHNGKYTASAVSHNAVHNLPFSMMDEAKAPNIFGHLYNIKNTDE